MICAPTYRGRFAPSPTGPLHFGSLLTAVGSYLDARHHQGEWLLRIEDLDPPREVAGAADAILRGLENHGLTWDHSVLYQSTRLPDYRDSLDALKPSECLFPCSCTRAVLGPAGSCGRRCRPGADERVALRLALHDSVDTHDLILGPQQWINARRDVVLRRKDGLFAYALAVVVDDDFQAITHVLRGQDLLAETAVQRELMDRLGMTAPRYGHLPLLCGAGCRKLSKQAGASALNERHALANLRAALRWLGQDSADAEAGTAAELLAIAVPQWRRDPLIANAGRPVHYAADTAAPATA